MTKSKTRLVADFISKVEADPDTGEVKHQEVAAMYNQTEIDEMFDDVITEMETLSTAEQAV